MTDELKTLKFFIYCRKSSESEDKQILSLPAQEQILRELAANNKLHIVDVYLESGSAHSIGRKKFNEMLRRIENVEADGIIVWDESRIARNAMDAGRVIYMIDLEKLKAIVKPGRIYKNTPDDKSWLAMCFMMSKKESDDKGVNVKRGLRTKANQGWYPSSWTKPGYMWNKMDDRGNKTLLNDPIRFPLIKKSWEFMISGSHTVAQILRILNEEWGYKNPVRKTTGGTPMARSQIYKMFTDTFYYGEYEYKDNNGNTQIHIGNHNPMITKEEFDRVQILLGRKGKPRPQKHDFPHTGIIHCGECNAMISAQEKWQMICSSCKYKFAKSNRDACPNCSLKIEEMNNPKILHYIYYCCTKKLNPKCTQRSITIDKLELEIDLLLSQINISEDFKEWAIDLINKENDADVNTEKAIISSLQNSYNDSVAELRNLLKFKISPRNSDGSLLSDEDYEVQKNELMVEKKRLEKLISESGANINKKMEEVENKFSFAVHARYDFETGNTQKKREILSSLGTNLILKDNKLYVRWENMYGFIERMVKDEPTISARSEPKKLGLSKAQLETYWSRNPSVLRD